MALTSSQYLAQLQALLPTGVAWTKEPDADLTGLLVAIADELARIDHREADLVEEADPRTTVELLEDWERLCGMADECEGLSVTFQERRSAVHAKLLATGGQSRQYYIDLAAALGVEVQIQEFFPFRAGYSTAGDPLANDDGWRHIWQVDAPETTEVSHFAAGSSAAGEPIRRWGDELLECVITRVKPAHTAVQFAYYL